MELDLEFCERSVLLTGLEDAIIGKVEDFSSGCRILYSKNKIIEILMNRDNMTEEEALEFYSFNIIELYINEQNPVFLLD